MVVDRDKQECHSEDHACHYRERRWKKYTNQSDKQKRTDNGQRITDIYKFQCRCDRENTRRGFSSAHSACRNLISAHRDPSLFLVMRKGSSAFLAIDSVVRVLFSALSAKHKGYSGNDTGTRSSNKKA